jgi:hypothetical protein
MLQKRSHETYFPGHVREKNGGKSKSLLLCALFHTQLQNSKLVTAVTELFQKEITHSLTHTCTYICTYMKIIFKTVNKTKKIQTTLTLTYVIIY